MPMMERLVINNTEMVRLNTHSTDYDNRAQQPISIFTMLWEVNNQWYYRQTADKMGYRIPSRLSLTADVWVSLFAAMWNLTYGDDFILVRTSYKQARKYAREQTKDMWYVSVPVALKIASAYRLDLLYRYIEEGITDDEYDTIRDIYGDDDGDDGDDDVADDNIFENPVFVRGGDVNDVDADKVA
jgi:hypothetical protein